MNKVAINEKFHQLTESNMVNRCMNVQLTIEFHDGHEDASDDNEFFK